MGLVLFEERHRSGGDEGVEDRGWETSKRDENASGRGAYARRVKMRPMGGGGVAEVSSWHADSVTYNNGTSYDSSTSQTRRSMEMRGARGV